MKIIQQYDDMNLDPPRHSFIIEADPNTIHDDIHIMDAWLKNNLEYRYRRSPRQMAGRFIVDIFDPKEAMLFKMVWK